VEDSDDSRLSAKNWKLLESHAGRRARIVCVANQKGGVGKTTTTVNLAAALALRGHRVLVIDVDPQANATTGLGIDHRALQTSTYELLAGDASLAGISLPTAIEGLSCAPASLNLAGAEIELVGEMAREMRLSEALTDDVEDYALVLVDCPPSLGLLTVNALAAADDLLVPVQCEYYALEGLGQLLGTAERVRAAVNPELRIAGFLLTMFDARTKLAGQVAADVRKHFGRRVFDTVIPRSVRLSEAPSFGEPVLTLDPTARGAIAYRLLAQEVEALYKLDVHPPPPPAEVGRVTSSPATPGPGGRGYGITTARPAGLERAWPPRDPYSESGEAKGQPGRRGGKEDVTP